MLYNGVVNLRSDSAAPSPLLYLSQGVPQRLRTHHATQQCILDADDGCWRMGGTARLSSGCRVPQSKHLPSCKINPALPPQLAFPPIQQNSWDIFHCQCQWAEVIGLPRLFLDHSQVNLAQESLLRHGRRQLRDSHQRLELHSQLILDYLPHLAHTHHSINPRMHFPHQLRWSQRQSLQKIFAQVQTELRPDSAAVCGWLQLLGPSNKCFIAGLQVTVLEWELGTLHLVLGFTCFHNIFFLYEVRVFPVGEQRSIIERKRVAEVAERDGDGLVGGSSRGAKIWTGEEVILMMLYILKIKTQINTYSKNISVELYSIGWAVWLINLLKAKVLW